MCNGARELRESVIRALAKVGLVWAVAVLGFMFMAMSAQGRHPDAYRVPSAGADGQSSSFAVSSGEAPRTAGLALALVVLGGGVTVLVVGAGRGDRHLELGTFGTPDPASDLPLALGLGLLA